MQRFKRLFPKSCNIIGMIHVGALPGTPQYQGNFDSTIKSAVEEAQIYSKHGLDAVIVENMHDVPYTQRITPEVTACMTILVREVMKTIIGTMKCGVQILACGNRESLAVAKATGAQFIRNEGFVFSHVADEGFTDANAGDVLRYRKQIDAEDILVLTDIKKKHSSHSITADVSLLETAKAAEFFLSDGVILTGTGTGHAADLTDLKAVVGKLGIPILIGSGVTAENLRDYTIADALIIGSYFKRDGQWQNPICTERLEKFMMKLRQTI